MKKYILLIFFAPIILLAQDLSIWQNMRTSAKTNQDSVYFRCETTPDAMNFSKHLYYFSNNQWNADSLEILNGFTFQTKFPANQDSTNIRIAIEGNNMFSGMDAYVPSNNFPPNLSVLGECGADSVNEIDPQYDNCLDITNQYSGFNNDNIFGAMTTIGDVTNSGGWTGPYYVYGFAIANPVTAIQDTIGYAMIYAEIPVLLNPGLYKIHYNSENPIEGISRIGDIDYDISGNQLIMQASLDDLVNDPDFGEWLPESKYLISSTFTISINSTSDAGMVDYGVPALLELKKFMTNTGANNLPEISNVTSIANLVTCTYSDSDHNFPLIHEILTDTGDIFEMVPTSLDFSNDVQFTANITSPNWNTATIRFSDNNADFVENSIENTNNNDDTIPGNFQNMVVYPNPFISQNSRGQITIKFYAKNAEFTSINLYNIKGEKMLNIFNENSKKGENKIISTLNSSNLASGIYFVRINSAHENQIKKIMILK